MGATREIGPYRLLGVLGEGATATVFLAQHEETGERVVLKHLHPYLAMDQTFLERFWAEAAVARRLRHPNLVAVRESFEDEGDQFLVMEWVDGPSLREVLTRGRLHASLALQVVSEVLVGLVQLHRAAEKGAPDGLLHRDISPENVLLAATGEVKLTDLGLSAARAGREGKPGYLAPELLEGGSASVKSDVFAVGVVLREAMTGAREGDAATGEPALDALLAQVLAREAGLRPSASRFFRELEEVRSTPRLFATRESVAGYLRHLGITKRPAGLRDTDLLTTRGRKPGK
ncbi:MAG: serine/threonine protein kinase [Myxococcaceae bacterium]|nr:serine/threonine protein kinase [Myxococcaceae bacterium]